MNTWSYDVGNWYPDERSPCFGNGWIGGDIPLNGHGDAGNRYFAAVAANYMSEAETFRAVPHWLNVDLRVDGKSVEAWFFDFYMFPSRLLSQPQLARNMTDYRHGLLDGARANARNSGHAGPFENEIRITADIRPV